MKKGEKVIYVGKAKNLSNRVSSYYKKLEKILPKNVALALKELEKED